MVSVDTNTCHVLSAPKSGERNGLINRGIVQYHCQIHHCSSVDESTGSRVQGQRFQSFRTGFTARFACQQDGSAHWIAFSSIFPTS